MRRCIEPGCHVLLRAGSRCGPHEQRYRLERSRRAHGKRAGSGWAWQAIRERIIRRDGGCVMPGPHAGPLRVDHIRPLSQGGTNGDANLRTLCFAHHRSVTPNGGG